MELEEIRRCMREGMLYNSGDPGSLELPAKSIEKTYDYNATRPYDKPEKMLKSPELKTQIRIRKNTTLRGRIFLYFRNFSRGGEDICFSWRFRLVYAVRQG